MDKNRRILVYNVNWIGDVLLSTAAIGSLRRAFPGSYIASVVPERCREVLEGNRDLDEIIVFDERDNRRGILGVIDFILLLRNRRFDTCILLHRSMTRALFSFLAGIPERLGYDYKKHNFLLTRVVDPPDILAVHRLEYYLSLALAAGGKDGERKTEFYYGENDLLYAERLLSGCGINRGDAFVALNAGGNWGPKRWPAENFSLLADRLVLELGVKVAIVGSVGDKKLAQSIIAKMRAAGIDIAGRTSLKQLAAVFKMSSAVVSADSAPMHIAHAVGASLVCLLGPTAAHISGPYPLAKAVIMQKDSGCAVPCYEVLCPDNRCMRMIEVNDVFQAVSAALRNNNTIKTRPQG